MGAQRLHDRVRRDAHPGRQARRPHRAPQGVPGRLHRVHRGVRGVRAGADGRAADRVPRRPGRRRCGADPVVVGAGDARLHERPAAAGRGGLGRRRRRRRGPRSHAGRRDRRGARLAVGVLHQPAGRHLHRRGRASRPARVVVPRDADPLAARCRPHRRRGWTAVLRRGRLGGPRLAQCPHARDPRCRTGRPCRVRPAPATHEGPGARPRPVPHHQLPVGERRHAGVRHGVRGAVPRLDPLPHPGVGVVGAPGRLRGRAGSDHGGPRRATRRQARRSHRAASDPHRRRLPLRQQRPVPLGDARRRHQLPARLLPVDGAQRPRGRLRLPAALERRRPGPAGWEGGRRRRRRPGGPAVRRNVRRRPHHRVPRDRRHHRRRLRPHLVAHRGRRTRHVGARAADAHLPPTCRRHRRHHDEIRRRARPPEQAHHEDRTDPSPSSPAPPEDSAQRSAARSSSGAPPRSTPGRATSHRSTTTAPCRCSST